MSNEQLYQIGISDSIHSWDYNILNLHVFFTVINIFNKSIPMNPTPLVFQLGRNTDVKQNAVFFMEGFLYYFTSEKSMNFNN